MFDRADRVFGDEPIQRLRGEPREPTDLNIRDPAGLSQFLSVPGRTPRYSAACSTDKSGHLRHGACTFDGHAVDLASPAIVVAAQAPSKIHARIPLASGMAFRAKDHCRWVRAVSRSDSEGQI